MPRVKTVAHKGKGIQRQFKDVPKFCCPQAEAKYHNQIFSRELYCERGLVANSEILIELPGWLCEDIDNRGWSKFVLPPEPAVPEVVREFYANFLSKDWPTVVTVREVPVQFSAEALNDLFGIESVDCAFTPTKGEIYGEELEFVLETVAQSKTWAVDEAENVHLRRTDLQHDLKCLYSFLQTTLCPTSHDSTVSKARAFMLFCIRIGLPVDVGTVLANEIRDCAQRSKGKLFLPATITALCQLAGVAMWREEGRLPPKAAVSFGPSRAQKTQRAAASSSQQVPAASLETDLAAQFTQFTMMQQQMHHRQGELCDRMQTFWQYEQQRDGIMERTFKKITPRVVPQFPQFPQQILNPWSDFSAPTPAPEDNDDESE